MGPFEAAGEDPASVVTDVEEEKTSMKRVQRGAKNGPTLCCPQRSAKKNADLHFLTPSTLQLLYREGHLVRQYGWVNIDFGSSTLYIFLLGLLRNWQNWLSSWALW